MSEIVQFANGGVTVCALEPQTYLVIFIYYYFLLLYIYFYSNCGHAFHIFALTIASIYNICGSVFQDWFSFLSIQVKF